jgi:hypothetical protein
MKHFGLIIITVFAQTFLLMLPVQATHKERNGCGDDTGLGRFVPNQPVGVDFRPVCDNHDECYGILGESRENCDDIFRSALRAKCEKTLLSTPGGIFGTILTGGGDLVGCYGVAETYYQAVRAGGGKAYSTAQDHAREDLPSSPAPVPAIAASNYQRFRLQTGTALHETGNEFAFGVLPNGDVVAIKKSGTGSGKTEVHILAAASNYQSFRLQTGTALHETGNEFAFGVLPNGDVVAIKKSGTGSGKTEVHILSLQ